MQPPSTLDALDQKLADAFPGRIVRKDLVRMVESNYNLIELGPRGTGKSFVYREITPFAILLSGGQTTVAQLFINLATGKIGLVGLWDVVAFDEVAGIRFKDSDGVQILKDYMESGSFSRGKEEMPAEAGIVFNGNIDGDIATLVKTSHLLQPLSETMQDLALIDRLHFYLPGWEMDKMRPEYFTGHYGFVVDYITEVWRWQRKTSYAGAIDATFSLGSHRGNPLKVGSLTERLELAMDNGASRVLLPSENKRDFADIPSEVLDKLQIVFYSDPANAALRALQLDEGETEQSFRFEQLALPK